MGLLTQTKKRVGETPHARHTIVSEVLYPNSSVRNHVVWRNNIKNPKKKGYRRLAYVAILNKWNELMLNTYYCHPTVGSLQSIESYLQVKKYKV